MLKKAGILLRVLGGVILIVALLTQTGIAALSLWNSYFYLMMAFGLLFYVVGLACQKLD